MKKISALLASVLLFGQTASAEELIKVRIGNFDGAGNDITVITVDTTTGTETVFDTFRTPFNVVPSLSTLDQYNGNLVLAGGSNGGGIATYNFDNQSVTLTSDAEANNAMYLPAVSTAGVAVISNNISDGAAITVDTTNSTVRLSNGAIANSSGTNIISEQNGQVQIGSNALIVSDGAIANSSGDNIISNQNGEIHIGENSLVTVENGGRQELFATDAAGNAINIDITRGTDLRVNGTSVMGSISGLGEGVKATTALNAAFSAVPAFSGDSQFECGVGTGAYGDKYALAGGCGVALSEAVSFNAGASVLPSGSESYGVGTLPEYALKAGLSVKFGPSLKRKSIAALSNSGNDGFNRLALSDARNEADTAKQVAAAALERAANSDAKAEAAMQELSALRQQAAQSDAKAEAAIERASLLEAKVAALEAYKDKVDVIFAALQNNEGNLNLASFKH
jgi:hypothetical protein